MSSKNNLLNKNLALWNRFNKTPTISGDYLVYKKYCYGPKKTIWAIIQAAANYGNLFVSDSVSSFPGCFN